MTGNPQITFFGGGAGSPIKTSRENEERYPKPTKEQLEARKDRLEAAKAKRLYHQTSPEAAKAILQTGQMLRGSYGLAGGGIYFATTPAHTEHKALHKGVILECEVKLGRTLKLIPAGDSTMCYRKLLAMDKGYDSVLIPRTGDEYVIYNSDQVKSVTKYQSPKSSGGNWWF